MMSRTMESLKRRDLLRREFDRFNVLGFLKDHNVSHRRQSSDEVIITCPVCKREDHFYFNIDKKLGTCHRCKWACNLVTFIMSFGYDREGAILLIRGEEDTSPSGIKNRVGDLLEDVYSFEVEDFSYYPTYFVNEIPTEGIVDISKEKFPKAIKERRFNYNLVKDLEIKLCTKGYYKNRLIIPVKTKKTRTFFAPTAFTKRKYEAIKGRMKERGENFRKSLFPKGSFMGEVLYRFDEVKDSFDDLFVVEGFWDFLRLRKYEVNSTACFGSHVSFSQMVLLSETDAERIYLMLDGDVPFETLEKNFNLMRAICFDKEVRLCRLPEDKDPDTLSFKEFKKVVSRSKGIIF